MKINGFSKLFHNTTLWW